MAQYGVNVSNTFDALDDAEGGPKKAKEVEQEKKPVKAPQAAPKAPEASRTLDAPTKRGGLRGRGRGRGGRGRGTGKREPLRFFDRHSGTGRGKEVRKGGYGGYDAAGTMHDDLKAGEVAEQMKAEDAKPVDGAAPTAEPAQPAELSEEQKQKLAEEEEEKKKKTYSQYLEQMREKQCKDDLNIQIRKVEVDEKKFKACKELAKHEDQEWYCSASQKDDDKKKGESKKKAKKSESLDEFVQRAGGPAPAPVENSFRGRGRGGFRGGRGRGGPRGGRGGRGGAGAPVNVNIADEAAFPKLGK